MDTLAAWHLACLLVVWTACSPVVACQLLVVTNLCLGPPPFHPQQQEEETLHFTLRHAEHLSLQLTSIQLPLRVPGRHLSSHGPGWAGTQLIVALLSLLSRCVECVVQMPTIHSLSSQVLD